MREEALELVFGSNRGIILRRLAHCITQTLYWIDRRRPSCSKTSPVAGCCHFRIVPWTPTRYPYLFVFCVLSCVILASVAVFLLSFFQSTRQAAIHYGRFMGGSQVLHYTRSRSPTAMEWVEISILQPFALHNTSFDRLRTLEVVWACPPLQLSRPCPSLFRYCVSAGTFDMVEDSDARGIWHAGLIGLYVAADGRWEMVEGCTHRGFVRGGSRGGSVVFYVDPSTPGPMNISSAWICRLVLYTRDWSRGSSHRLRGNGCWKEQCSRIQ